MNSTTYQVTMIKLISFNKTMGKWTSIPIM